MMYIIYIYILFFQQEDRRYTFNRVFVKVCKNLMDIFFFLTIGYFFIKYTVIL
jgi:hypothetical protein